MKRASCSMHTHSRTHALTHTGVHKVWQQLPDNDVSSSGPPFDVPLQDEAQQIYNDWHMLHRAQSFRRQKHLQLQKLCSHTWPAPYCTQHDVHQSQSSRAAVTADDHSNAILQTLLGLMLEAMCHVHILGLDQG